MPVGIRGAHDSMPVGGMWPRPSRIVVDYGKSMSAPKTGDKKVDREATDKFVREIMVQVSELTSR